MTKDRKVLHVTQALGGVQTYLENILNHSFRSATQFIVIAPEDPEFRNFCTTRFIKYYPLTIKRSIDPLNDLKALFKIIRYIRKEKPSIIHAHSAKGGFLGRLAGKLCGKKVFYTPHAFSYLSFTGLKRIIFYSLEYIAKRWTNLVIAVSYSEASRACSELGYAKSKVSVILNSINVDESKLRTDYSSGINIGMISRLTYQKNPILFLEIANTILKKYPEVKFSILGGGMHDHLIKDIKEFMQRNNLNEKIVLEDWGSHNKSDQFLEDTDIYVMTSVFEGLPYSLLEAMSKGIPCVVSKSDGNSDVIQNNENGFACSTLDEFCNKIELLINRESLRRKIGQAGFHYVREKHEITKAVLQLEATYIDEKELGASVITLPVKYPRKAFEIKKTLHKVY